MAQWYVFNNFSIIKHRHQIWDHFVIPVFKVEITNWPWILPQITSKIRKLALVFFLMNFQFWKKNILFIYHSSANSFCPWIVSYLELFPLLNSFHTFMYCNQRSPNSKKNSFHGNYSRKYGMKNSICESMLLFQIFMSYIFAFLILFFFTNFHIVLWHLSFFSQDFFFNLLCQTLATWGKIY